MFRLICILGNRYAGFVLGMVVILNLAVGSLVMDHFPKTYLPFFPNDLGFFFDPVQAKHAWLYTLLVTFSLFAVNLIACIIETVVRMVRARSARLRQMAALLFHLSLVLILLAHLHDGVYGNEYRMALDDQPQEIPGIGMVRVESLQSHYHPDGSLKDTDVALWIRLTDGRELHKRIAYNEPAMFSGGMREIIIQQGEHRPSGLIVTRVSDDAPLRLMPHEPYRIEGGHLVLRGASMSKMGVPIADLLWLRKDGTRQQLFMVLNGRASRHTEIEIAGERYRYQAPVTTPVAFVMVRYNPAIPLVLAGLLLASLGTILLIGWQRRLA